MIGGGGGEILLESQSLSASEWETGGGGGGKGRTGALAEPTRFLRGLDGTLEVVRLGEEEVFRICGRRIRPEIEAVEPEESSESERDGGGGGGGRFNEKTIRAEEG